MRRSLIVVVCVFVVATPDGAAAQTFDINRVTLQGTISGNVYSDRALVEAKVAPHPTNPGPRPYGSVWLYNGGTEPVIVPYTVSPRPDADGRWNVRVTRVGPLRAGSNVLRFYMADGNSNAYGSRDITLNREVRTPFGLNVFLTSIEATQVIQGVRAVYSDRRRTDARSPIDLPGTSSSNAVPLIAGKRTVIRVSAAAEGTGMAPVGPVYASLTAVRNGATLGTRVTTGLTIEGVGAGDSETTRVREHARDEEPLTFDFTLPSAWTYGDVTFNVALNVDGATVALQECSGCKDVANNGSVRVVFQPSGQVYVLPWKVIYDKDRINNNADDLAVDPLTGSGFFSSVQSLFPVAHEAVNVAGYRGTIRSYTTDIGQVLEALKGISTLGSAPAVTFTGKTAFAGVMHESAPFSGPGRASSNGQDFVAQVNGERWTPAHELAHTVGYDHADCQHGEDDGGGCESTFPEFHGTIGNVKGFDTYRQVAIDDYNDFGNGVGDLAPHDLLSYGPDRWISRTLYMRLLQRLSTDQDLRPNEQIATASQTRPGRRLVVAGVIRPDGGSLTSLYQAVSRTRDPLPRTGAFSVTVLDGAGRTLHARSFEPRDSEKAGGQRFLVVLPIQAGAVSIQLRRGDQVLDTRTRSANAPTVKWTDPPAPRPLESRGFRTVGWTAGDADKDALTYVFQYSRDGGKTWRTIDSGIPDLNYALDMATIEGTQRGRFRVLATDGFHTVADDSDRVFAVPDKPPFATIVAPARPFPSELPAQPENAPRIPPAAATVEAGGGLQLAGGAVDPEQGRLGGRRLRWGSSLDGAIGGGRNVEWASPSIGRHLLTLVARDSGGRVGSDQVIVDVTPATIGGPAPRVLSVRARPGRVTVRFSAPVVGLSGNGLKVVGAGLGRLSVSGDRRTATLSGLKRRSRYRVRIGGRVTSPSGVGIRSVTRTVRARG